MSEKNKKDEVKEIKPEKKEEVKEIKPNAVEMLTGEKPKVKEKEIIDTKTTTEEMLNLSKEVEDSKQDIMQDEILDLIFNEEKLAMTTDISRKGAVVMARAHLIADTFHCDILRNFANKVKEHLVSNKRQGRKELIDVASSFRDSLGGDLGVEETSTTDRVWGKK